jgi:hypothetical protein
MIHESHIPDGRVMRSRFTEQKLPRFAGLIGLSFWQSWWMLAMCTDILLPDSTGSFPFTHVSMAVLLATLVGYMAVAATSVRLDDLTKHSSLFIVVAVLCVCGSLGMSLSAHTASLLDYAGSLFLISVLMFGVGNAALLIMWGELWSTLATGQAGRHIYISYTVAFLIFFLVHVLPLVVEILATSLLPMVSLLMLKAAQAEPRRNKPPQRKQDDHFPLKRILAAVFIANFVWGITQRLLAHVPQSADPTMKAFVLAGICLAILALSFMVFRPSSPEPALLYRPIIPSICGGLILITVLPQEYLFIGDGLLILGGYCLDIIILLVASDLAFHRQKPVAITLGTAVIVARLGSLAGTVTAGSISMTGV